MLSSRRMHLAKVRTKVKRKWRNFLSGQNAILSPRATNLLGRGSWFACAPIINCICRWQSPPHSGLKRKCWLSLAFDVLVFLEHFHNSWSHSFLIKSLWGPIVGINTLYCIHSITRVIEMHKNKVICLSHIASCAVRDLLSRQRNFRKIFVLFVWVAHDSISGDLSSFFGSVSELRKFRMGLLKWICFSDLWDHCVFSTDWSEGKRVPS